MDNQNTRVLLSVFKLFYAQLRRPDGTLNYVAETVDRKVRPNMNHVIEYTRYKLHQAGEAPQ
ncbi:hypothetical protein MKW92_036770, partial [Papaver armeniacum]